MMGGMEHEDRLLTVMDLADYLGVPVATIYAWRYRGEGPPGFRVGRHVRFRRRDVEEWIKRQLKDASRSASVGPKLYGRRWPPRTQGYQRQGRDKSTAAEA